MSTYQVVRLGIETWGRAENSERGNSTKRSLNVPLVFDILSPSAPRKTNDVRSRKDWKRPFPTARKSEKHGDPENIRENQHLFASGCKIHERRTCFFQLSFSHDFCAVRPIPVSRARYREAFQILCQQKTVNSTFAKFNGSFSIHVKIWRTDINEFRENSTP